MLKTPGSLTVKLLSHVWEFVSIDFFVIARNCCVDAVTLRITTRDVVLAVVQEQAEVARLVTVKAGFVKEHPIQSVGISRHDVSQNVNDAQSFDGLDTAEVTRRNEVVTH
jgi:hypothetical protein